MLRAVPQPSLPVLVVDDDPVQRTLLEAFFTVRGYPVATAADGQTALQLINDSFFPVVITDWMMPGLDGIELCRRVSLRRRRGPARFGRG